MSENRFDTSQSDAVAASSAATSEASVKATLQAAQQISDKLVALTNAMTNSQTLQNEAFENVLIGLVTQLNVNQSSITDKLSVADVSMNEQLTTSMITIADKLSAADVSMNEQMTTSMVTITDKLSAADVSMNAQMTTSMVTITDKLSAADVSMNTQMTTSMVTITDKLSAADVSMNAQMTTSMVTITDKLSAADVSMNTQMTTSMVTITDKLSAADVSMNAQMTTSMVTITDKLSAADVSMNAQMTTSMVTITDKLSAADVSMNAQMTTSMVTITDKLSAADVSMNAQMTTSMVTITDKLSAADVSMNAQTNSALAIITEKLSAADVSMNEQMTTSMVTIASTLSAVDVSMIQQIMKINDNATSNQNTLMQYIGQYIVIPLYKQRIADVNEIYHKKLQGSVLYYLDLALSYFKVNDFFNLNKIFGVLRLIELSDLISLIKKEAFIHFLKLTPGANSFNDMSIEVKNSYKSFRKYTVWAFKTIDVIHKGTSLYNRNVSLDAQVQIGCVNQEILESEEMLKIYIDEVQFAISNMNTGTGIAAQNINTNILSMNLKPEISEYIARYGLPVDMQFDFKKLSLVINDLRQLGLYPEAEIENNSTSGLGGGSSEFTSDNPDDITATDTDTATSGDGTPRGLDTATATDTATDSTNDSHFADPNDFSESALSVDDVWSDFDVELDTKIVFYVYSNEEYDPSSNILNNKYHYPLFLNRTDAEEAVSSLSPDPTIDVTGHVYSLPDVDDPSGVTMITFPWVENYIFWQPNSHPYRSVGTIFNPPSLLEYRLFTESTGLSGIIL
mgnify:CR=1 FL=1